MSEIATAEPAVVSRTRKPRGEGASRRGEILAAATRIFLADGIAGATMRRIASAVGLSPTALYVYFPDKTAIIQAIAENAFANLLDIVRNARPDPNDPAAADPDLILRTCLHAYVEFGLANPDAYRLTFLSDMTSLPHAPCEKVADAEAAFGELRQTVELMIQLGRFRPGDPTEIAEALWAMLHGVTSLLLDHRKHLLTSPDALIGRIIDTAIAGLRVP